MSHPISKPALAVAFALAVGTSPAVAAPPQYRVTPIPHINPFRDANQPLFINNKGQVMGILYGDESATTYLFNEGRGNRAIAPQPQNFCCVYGHALNRRGDIVGRTYDWDDGPRTFKYINNVFSYFTFAGMEDVFASDINGRRQIVGYGLDPTSQLYRVAIWESGVTTFLPWSGTEGLSSLEINDAGHVMGSAGYGTMPSRSFLYKDGLIAYLGSLGGSMTSATAINGTGVVIGTSTIAGGMRHAFRYEEGQLIDLGTLGGDESEAFAINNAGHVAGSAQTASGQWHAFLHDGVSMYDIGISDEVESAIFDITENGQAIGEYVNLSGSRPLIFGVDGPRSFDLQSLISMTDPLRPYVTLYEAVGVNELGQVVARARVSGVGNRLIRAVLLTPIDSTPPVIAPARIGTRGLSGWFTGTVTVNWGVSDAHAPVASKRGCDSSTVSSDTKSQKFTCKATSIGGTATKTVAVKRDSTRPIATITRPASGAVFNRNQFVTASFVCSDATSGIRSCVGTKGNGVRLDTSRQVTNATFRVTGTDNAGLVRTVTTTYSVR